MGLSDKNVKKKYVLIEFKNVEAKEIQVKKNVKIYKACETVGGREEKRECLLLEWGQLLLA